MPLPTPNDTEDHDEFIDRCMSDASMQNEYADGKQRLEVCETQWSESRSSQGECRAFRVADFELRERKTKELPRIRGHAAVFNSLSEPLFRGIREVILPGAFTQTLEDNDDVRALVDHDPSKIIGRTRAGTLKLREDAKGLFVDIDPAETTAGRDIVESIRRGDVSNMSFAFRTVQDQWRTVDGEERREVVAAKLFDVSLVSFPAYTETDVAIAKRSWDAWKAGRTITTGDGTTNIVVPPSATSGVMDAETARCAALVADMEALPTAPA
jgi:HK97 family phage prohead protease